MVMKMDNKRNESRMERSLMVHKPVEQKQINVSEKRQITIPKHFYDKLDMGQEIVCELRGDEIVLRNVPQADDFSEEILKDLVSQGFEGNNLIKEFQKQKSQIRPAVEKMMEESRLAAENMDGNSDDLMEELFGDLKE